MSKEKQLAKNTAIVAIGKICTQFVSFFLLPLYTTVLSAEEYGVVDILNTYVSLLIPIAFLQADQASFRFLIDERKNESGQKRIISTILKTFFRQAITYIVVFLVISLFINNNYKYFLATNVLASAFAGLLLQISRGLGDNLTYSLGSLVSGVGTIILNVLFIVVFRWGAYGMLAATFVANILSSAFVFFRKKLYRLIDFNKYSKKTRKEIWKYSIPLVPNQLSWWVVNASDRTIVTTILGSSVNGIYAAANKFSSICISIFNIFNLAWAESATVTEKEKDSDEYYSKITNVSIKFFSSLCLGVVAVMPFVFGKFIKNPEYADGYYQVPILMISTIFCTIVSLVGSVYTALKKTKEIARTSIYAAIINIVTDLALIKFIGLYAASISTLISYIAMTIYRLIDVQKYKKIKIKASTIIATFSMMAVVLPTYYTDNIILHLASFIVVAIIAIFINKNVIKGIFVAILGKIKRKLNFKK